MPEPAADLAVSCLCGRAELALTGSPIMTVECLCNGCREAGRMFHSAPEENRLLDGNGATLAAMYRKDRVQCTRGSDVLAEFRLKPESKTRRVIATCCNSPMLMEFTSGHWVDIYAHRWPEGKRPLPEYRTMTGDLPNGTELPRDIPNLKRHSLHFFARLAAAWIAMGLRAPDLDFVKRTLTRRQVQELLNA